MHLQKNHEVTEPVPVVILTHDARLLRNRTRADAHLAHI